MYEMEEMGEPLLSSIHESYPNHNPKLKTMNLT